MKPAITEQEAVEILLDESKKYKEKGDKGKAKEYENMAYIISGYENTKRVMEIIRKPADEIEYTEEEQKELDKLKPARPLVITPEAVPAEYAASDFEMLTYHFEYAIETAKKLKEEREKR